VPPSTSHRAGSVLSPAVTSPPRRPRSFYAAMRASPPRPRPAAAADAAALREMVDDVMQHLPPTPSQGGAEASGAAAAAAGVGEPAGAREASAAGPQGGKEAKDENRRWVVVVDGRSSPRKEGLMSVAVCVSFSACLVLPPPTPLSAAWRGASVQARTC
jgi:hypothetical protein